jgi:hypothetical protein
LVVKVVEVMGDHHPDRRLLVTTAALASGAALAKPALTIALVSALMLLLTVDRSVAAM